MKCSAEFNWQWNQAETRRKSIGRSHRQRHRSRSQASFLDDFSELLNNDRPLAVIGPLLSKNLPVMAELARALTHPAVHADGDPAQRQTARQLYIQYRADLSTAGQTNRGLCHQASTASADSASCIPIPPMAARWPVCSPRKCANMTAKIIAIESYKEGESDVGAQFKRMKAEDLKKYGLVRAGGSDETERETDQARQESALYAGLRRDLHSRPRADVGLIAAQLNFHDMKVPFLGAMDGTHRTLPARPIRRLMEPYSSTAFCGQPQPDRAGFCRSGIKNDSKPPRPFSPCRATMPRRLVHRCGSKKAPPPGRRARSTDRPAGLSFPGRTGGVRTGRDTEPAALSHTGQTGPISAGRLTGGRSGHTPSLQ